MSIRKKFIILLLLIGAIPTLAVSIVAYISISDSLLNKTIDQLSSIEIKQDQKISTFLQARREEATKLANQFGLQIALQEYIASPSDASKNKLAQILQDKKIEAPIIQSLFLTDLSGNLIATSTERATGAQSSGLEAPTGAQEASVQIRKDPSDGFTKLYVTTLVSVNKQRTALLTATFRTDDLIAIVQDYTGLDSTGETVVVTTSSPVSLFPLRFDTGAALTANLSGMDLTKMDGMAYKQVTDYRGEQVLVVSHQIGLTDWVVATKVDRSEALSETIALRNSIFGIVLAAVIAIVVVALFFTQLFTRPILRLARVSERIGRGDFAARANIKQRDELGDLAASVNAMGANLSDMVGSIELQRMRLQIILDSTTETIFAIDDQANVVLVNRSIQGLLQTDPARVVGKNMRDIFDFKHGLQSFTVDYDVKEVHTYSDLQYVDSRGIQRYVKLIVSPVKDPSHAGSANSIVTIHDETSSHELENMKTDFVSMAAHELRTPLTAVRGYLEMVQYKQEHNDTKDTESYVRQALKNVGDLGGLINNLLDVTRIERGTLTLNMEKIDLAEDIARAVEDQRFAAGDRQITLSYNGPQNNCFVVGDSIALREVIDNLLSNAIKYTRPQGKITVSLVQEGATYAVSVQDTGIGIPAKSLNYLFTKFYRVHGGLDSGSTGTGLGLYISKSIIERHRGTIKVASKEGVGSTFTYSLPVYSDAILASLQPSKDKKEAVVRRKRGWITKNITR